MLNDALAYLKSGLSVIPTDPKTKKPRIGSWSTFQKVRPTPDQVEGWFHNGASLAVIAGIVSGNLEFIDFDEKGILKKWSDLLISWNCGHLLAKLVVEKSPSGGAHVGYRYEGPPAGNMKLAMTADKKVRIETRGEGGYCIIAPSPGYELKQGKWANLSVITADERDILLAAARYFDEALPDVPKPAQGDTVWADYNARASIDEIVIPLGWTRGKRKGEEEEWIRPGKNARDGISATYNWKGLGLFRVFSTNCGLDERAYDKWGLFARLHHNGDFKAATIAARGSGYGSDAKTKVLEVQTRYEGPPVAWQTLADVPEEDVAWFLRGRIPKGALTLLQGDPGIGKSSCTRALIAAATAGGIMPTGDPSEPTNVILLACEDSPEKVLRKSLREMGADLNRVIIVAKQDGEEIPAAAALESLEECIVAKKVEFVVIDPIIEYINSQTDINAGNQVRAFLVKLRGISERTNCAIVLVHHLNKSTGSKAIYRAVGSIDFIAAVRSVLMCGCDPDDNSVRALSHEKCNWGALQEALGFTFEDGQFRWTGHSDLDGERMSEPRDPRARRWKVGDVREWLIGLLSANHAAMPRKNIEAAAKDEQISWRTVERAKALAGVLDRRVSVGNEGKGYSEWFLETNMDEQWWGDK